MTQINLLRFNNKIIQFRTNKIQQISKIIKIHNN